MGDWGAAVFDERYDVLLARTPATEAAHHWVRYKVYCEERGFEPRDRFPDQQERDGWDDDAVKFVVKHRGWEEYTAAVRLVQGGSAGFPAEHYCELDQGHLRCVEPGQVAELSRLCVINGTRQDFWPGPTVRRADSTANPATVVGIFWGLMRAALRYSERHDIRHWYFVTTRGMAKILQRNLIESECIGAPCVLGGLRYPYLVDVHASRQRILQSSSRLAGFYRADAPYHVGHHTPEEDRQASLSPLL